MYSFIHTHSFYEVPIIFRTRSFYLARHYSLSPLPRNNIHLVALSSSSLYRTRLFPIAVLPADLNFLFVNITLSISLSKVLKPKLTGEILPARIDRWRVVVSGGCGWQTNSTPGIVDPRGAGGSAFIEIRTDTCLVVVRRT